MGPDKVARDESPIDRGYYYAGPQPTYSNSYVWPVLFKVLKAEGVHSGKILDLGCGGGATAGELAERGFSVTAVDSSATGIAAAAGAYPKVKFVQASAYEALAEHLGTFSSVVSLEVVEHCFWPRRFAKTIYDALNPGGLTVISTPYHGYLKNVALAVLNQMDRHWNPLWDGGHIKFWSVNTMTRLLEEVGFREMKFHYAGRLWPFSKSMVVTARR